MILCFVGIIGLIFSIIITAIGIIKNSKQMKYGGLLILIIPLFSYGIIFFWYGLIISNFNNTEMSEYSGKYHSNSLKSKIFLRDNNLSEREYSLKLNNNGTYQFDSTAGINLWKIGNWETGGVDGSFYFYNNEDKLVEIIYPLGTNEFYKLKFQYSSLNKEFDIPSTITFLKQINKSQCPTKN